MKTNFKSLLLTLTVGLLGGVLGFAVLWQINKPKLDKLSSQIPQPQAPVQFTSGTKMHLSSDLDFTYAAEKAQRAVVHIRTEYYNDNITWNWLFGGPMELPPIKGSGSGVIISPDGYIVTNNHVIENAVNINVTLFDKRTYKAKVIGRDPQTDIALIKIDADSLPVLPFGDSDAIKVGQWVLAVGNPFNLTSTVTAGIISAKGRNISILDRRYAIESFIQTDAVINPGNSGGALVNLKGELIGINTAIASPTGSYAGYGFAVPVSIVQKVVADLLEYGSVQRAFLGVAVSDIDNTIADKYNLKSLDGVIVQDVKPNGAAQIAGIKVGDVITAVDGHKINEVPELLEKIGQHRPGDQVTITVLRHNKRLDIPVTLLNAEGKAKVEKIERLDMLGATFEDLTPEDKAALGIKYGVKVVDLGPGKLRAAGVRPGFIIVKINDRPVKSVEAIRNVLNKAHGGIYIQGIYPDGTVAYYAFGIR